RPCHSSGSSKVGKEELRLARDPAEFQDPQSYSPSHSLGCCTPTERLRLARRLYSRLDSQSSRVPFAETPLSTCQASNRRRNSPCTGPPALPHKLRSDTTDSSR